MRKSLRRMFAVACLLGVCLITTPPPARATAGSPETCAEEYARLMQEASTAYDNCSEAGVAATILLCAPLYAYMAANANQTYYGCIGAPIIQ